MSWNNESARHAASSKGISTTGITLTSRGLIGDMVALASLIGLDDMGKLEAKGYKKKDFTDDATKIAIYPLNEVRKSINWVDKELDTTDKDRIKQLSMLTENTYKEINKVLPKIHDKHIKEDLKEARDKYKKMYLESKKPRFALFTEDVKNSQKYHVTTPPTKFFRTHKAALKYSKEYNLGDNIFEYNIHMLK